jgi:hypothetical protein
VTHDDVSQLEVMSTVCNAHPFFTSLSFFPGVVSLSAGMTAYTFRACGHFSATTVTLAFSDVLQPASFKPVTVGWKLGFYHSSFIVPL